MKPFWYAAILAALLWGSPSSADAHDRCPSYSYETIVWNGWHYISVCRPYVTHHRHYVYSRHHHVRRAPRYYTRPHRRSVPVRRHHHRRRR